MSAGMLELTHLEAMLEDDCACRADHSIGGTTCTVAVTHRFASECFGVDKLICLSAFEYVTESFAKDGGCIWCLRPTATHWRVVPV